MFSEIPRFPKKQKSAFLLKSLKYLEGYARALTTNDGICRNSDETMTQFGFKNCILSYFQVFEFNIVFEAILDQ